MEKIYITNIETGNLESIDMLDEYIKEGKKKINGKRRTKDDSGSEDTIGELASESDGDSGSCESGS